MKTNQISIEDLIIRDPLIRTNVARRSLIYFISIYLADSIQYKFAPFHREMLAIAEDEKIRMAVFMAARGCGKSTLLTMAYPIWAVLGILKKRNVVIISQTDDQARLHFASLKRELENNELLRAEMGPFETDLWNSNSIILSKFGARITHLSVEKKIRGIKHGHIRPDLLILDDIESLESVKTKEGRDKIYSWLVGEVFPAGDNAKIIIVGTLLHNDSVLMRLKIGIEKGTRSGIFKYYPLVDTDGNILWPGKFPTMKEVDELKARIGDNIGWEREYMLRIIQNDSSPIKKEWIKHYDTLPPVTHPDYQFSAIGTDFAFSQNTKADKTAMVMARVFEHNSEQLIYILPNIVNQRLEPEEIREYAKMLSDSSGDGQQAFIFIEDTMGQRVFADDLRRDGYPAEEVRISGDKYNRVAVKAHLVQTAKVLFPRVENELEGQLVYFGTERFDDLVDAFSLLLSGISSKKINEPNIRWI